ncbi:calponin-homology domain-containing protein [Nephila pilipes]|uniref:Calponin-homology domain-containing protein n=1 Tax=Nephila pilipes TaxID=299642 RepID=A0A8X6TMR1_NEPPI|nr:calponin-homology domain-containing protein [Nephila pilipes]
MASIKKPGFKIETKPIIERKRRKSDLVVMWQSFWDISLFVIMEIWMTLTGILEAFKTFFVTNDVQEIRDWLQKYLTRVPNDFSESWRDGVLLCKLLNKLQPGCYPDANNLDTDFGLRNLSYAFHILEARFDITPKVAVEEVVTCSKGSDIKLIELLVQLKDKTQESEKDTKVKAEPKETEEDKFNVSTDTKYCIAKGTGLMVGFVGRPASFVVFYSSLSDLNIVVEVKGPSGSGCSERITKRSPKKKNTIKPWKPCSPHDKFVRSSSNGEDKTLLASGSQEKNIDSERYYIPLEYEINSNQINFTYVPVAQGDYRISILSHGKHVSDSPYLVIIEPTIRMPKNGSATPAKSALKFPSTRQISEDEQSIKASVKFQEPSERKERLGKILKRQVLRYIVKIDGKDIVVDTDSIDNLAPSLLKMDYELQKRPLTRRNSWGFVGDAERKVSVIRQFCIDLEELEQQSARMQRSQSLSFSSNSKTPVRKSSSYECEDIPYQMKLETVTEGMVSNFNTPTLSYTEYDDVFAYLDNKFDFPSEIKHEDLSKTCENIDLNSTQSLRDKLSKNNTNTRDLDQSYKTEQVEISHNSEGAEIENVPLSFEMPVDHLTCASAHSFRLNALKTKDFGYIGGNEAPATTPKTGGEKQVIESSPQRDNRFSRNKKETEFDFKIVRGKISEFADSVNSENNYIEEKPFTKTDVRTLNNQHLKKNPIFSTGDDKTEIREGNKSERMINSQILPNSGSKEENKNEEINNTPEGSQSTCLDVINTESFLDKNIDDKEKEQLTSKRPFYLNEQNKTLVYSNTKMNRISETKYQSMHRKNPSQYAFSFDEIHKKLSKDSKAFNGGEFQSPESKDLFSIPNEEIKKSGENLTSAQLIKFSSNSNDERKDLEKCSIKNDHHKNKHGSRMDISTSNTCFSVEGKLKLTNYLLNLNNKAKLNRNEPVINALHVTSNPRKEYQTLSMNLQNNFNDYHSLKNFKLNKKNSESIMSSSSANLELKFLNQINENFNDNNNTNGCFSRRVKIETGNPITFGQFNFKHFNPPILTNKESAVKRQIRLWENSTEKRDEKSQLKYENKLHVLPELVNIKDKLKFWENAYNPSSEKGCKKINSDDMNKSERKSSDATNSTSSGIASKDKHSIETENTVSIEKNIEEKIMLNAHQPRTQKRSFSDPGVIEPSNKDINGELEYENEVVNPASSKDEMSSSYDGNFVELSADDEESSVEHFCSTEDEYIDDEISENISTYWGDLSLVKEMKFCDTSEYEEFLQLINSECFNEQCAAECKFFGIATYFGHVAVKNRFWVLTKGAGRGNLSASVQGFGQHDVVFVSVEYMQKDIYEITYQVLAPGLYLISVRWMDTPISGSPFLCKVTF